MSGVVYSVVIEGRFDGTYLFAKHSDAVRFAETVRSHNGEAWVNDEPVSDTAGTDDLIVAELEDTGTEA